MLKVHSFRQMYFTEEKEQPVKIIKSFRNNIYISFAFNITKGCDCEGHNMKAVSGDIGIFASTDPVAIDKVCLDMLDKVNGKTVFRRGRYTLEYAEKIGLGSMNYKFVELK
jgi:uncharacterized protein